MIRCERGKRRGVKSEGKMQWILSMGSLASDLWWPSRVGWEGGDYVYIIVYIYNIVQHIYNIVKWLSSSKK